MIVYFGACVIFSRSVSPSEVQEEGAGENGKLPRNNEEEEYKLQLGSTTIAEEEGKTWSSVFFHVSASVSSLIRN